MKTDGPSAEPFLYGPGAKVGRAAACDPGQTGRGCDGKRRGGPEGCGAYERLRTPERPRGCISIACWLSGAECDECVK